LFNLVVTDRDGERVKRRKRWFACYCDVAPLSGQVTESEYRRLNLWLRMHRGMTHDLQCLELPPEGRRKRRYVRNWTAVRQALRRGDEAMSRVRWLYDCGTAEDFGLDEMRRTAVFRADVHRGRAQMIAFVAGLQKAVGEARVCGRDLSACVAGRASEGSRKINFSGGVMNCSRTTQHTITPRPAGVRGFFYSGNLKI
jgi:hypothetical protein